MKVFDRSPFETLDSPGVGQLVRMGAWLGRKTKPSLKLGVCGEHGGDPDSIDFFHHSGIDYVSCSPYRVPVARVAAAQAAVRNVDPDLKAGWRWPRGAACETRRCGCRNRTRSRRSGLCRASASVGERAPLAAGRPFLPGTPA